MKKSVGFLVLFCISTLSFSQVDTSFIYNINMPYGTLDIRIAKSPTNYYYLDEGRTFSFRENGGVKTNTYRDMTTWDSSPYQEGNLREKSSTQDLFRMNYRLLKPLNYDANYAKGYPIIMMFHGAGERGNCYNNTCHHADRSYNPQTNNPPAPTSADHPLLNNDHNLLHGGKTYLEARNLAGSRLPDDPSMPERAFPGFILFPQNLNGWDNNAVQDAIRILRLIIKKYNIDEDRVFIHGLSNGGHGVFDALKRAPWMFAAATAMSAVDDASIINLGMEEKISQIPLWMFQGGLDQNPWPKETENRIKRFRDAGMEVRYTFYPHLGHGTWNDAYKEPDFFSWMLGKNKSAIHVFAGSATICEGDTEGLRLEVAEGFKAYQWERNGQVIPDAGTYFYMATQPGNYRARFSRISATPSENEWTEWSPPVEVKQQQKPVAEIVQTGTVLLKDLNGFTDARLGSANEFAHYYWYKDGVLIDHPGDQDDTVRYFTIKPGNCAGPCTNAGVYTLVTSHFDNCMSSESAPKYVFFNDQAPVNMREPLNLRGGAGSPSSILLVWIDATTHENGFEVWRRKKINESAFGPWEMATITPPNASSFNDLGLEPASTYQYKIRAVSNTGRSDYAPAGENKFLEVSTVPDRTPPSPPANLTVRATAVQTLTLSWDAAADNAGIREYHIYYNDQVIVTTETSITITDLPLNMVYSFTVKAIDVAGNESAPSESESGSTFMYGLFYEHSTGTWEKLDSIDWSRVEHKGIVYNFTLSPKTQDDYFNFRFDGFVFIEKAGSYQFRTSSNDGSRLRLDNKVWVNNDGIRNNMVTISSSTQALAAGPHRIQVEFFDFSLDDSLVVEYKGPDTQNNWKRVSESVLKSSLITGNSGDPTTLQPLIVNVYPNPSRQDVYVKVESLVRGQVGVRLIDAVGRAVFAHQFSSDEMHEGVKLSPAAGLTDGLYIVIINQGEHTVKKKLLVKH